MSPVRLYFKHLLFSFLILFLLVSALFYFKSYIEKIVSDPLETIFLSLVFIIVLFSFIFYLLLTYNTRFNLEIWNVTKNIALSKEQFKRLYEGAPVPYFLLNENAEIHDPNKATLRFFGVLPEEIEGKNIFSYISGEDKGRAERLFQFYKSSAPINRKEVDMVTKDRDVRSVELSVFETKDPSSSLSTGLGMIFDITEQKKLNKAKTEFVSLASHQLRSPLATTKWLTEMLISRDIGELSQKQSDYLDKLHTTNEDMISLVDVLLNISRIEMGSLSVDTKVINVEELLESILEESSHLINKKKMQIKREYNGYLKNIESDPKLLRIVIQNLISNALKYTPEGGIITITFEEKAGEKRIKISDTGLGIPKSQQDRIFTKSFRADNVQGLSDNQSTGLGLYLVKSMITSMGGSISFVSEESKGSTFTVML